MTRTKDLFKGEILSVLIIMTVMWICTTVNYTIINSYMKYVPGSRFINFTLVGCAEIAAHLSVGYLFLKLGPRATFILGYFIAAIGGACMMF
jgi:hypothetical protein